MREKIKLQKFVDELPILKTLSPKKRSNDWTYYEVTMKEFTQKLHRDLAPTRLWGYEGTYPGPTTVRFTTQAVQIITPYPSLVPPFDADTILVNGKVWPYMEVEPRKYRFRILNGSNSRILTYRCHAIQSDRSVKKQRY
jgi:FtsP/CotA-like multicopper oxidase with cupredoxin domain